ncbi:hypothetical protein [Kitasatospora sp. NPDC004289]
MGHLVEAVRRAGLLKYARSAVSFGGTNANVVILDSSVYNGILDSFDSGAPASVERLVHHHLREAAAASAVAPRHSYRRDLLRQGAQQLAELLAGSPCLEPAGFERDGSFDPLATTSAVEASKLLSCCDVEARLGLIIRSEWPQELIIEFQGGSGPRPPRNPIDDLAALLTLLTLALFSARAAFRLFVVGAHPAFVGYVPPTWACVCGTERLAGPVVPRGPGSALTALRRQPGPIRPTPRLGHVDSFVLAA